MAWETLSGFHCFCFSQKSLRARYFGGVVGIWKERLHWIVVEFSPSCTLATSFSFPTSSTRTNLSPPTPGSHFLLFRHHQVSFPRIRFYSSSAFRLKHNQVPKYTGPRDPARRAKKSSLWPRKVTDDLRAPSC